MTDPAKCSNITEYSRDKAPVLSLVKWRTHGVICVVEQSYMLETPSIHQYASNCVKICVVRTISREGLIERLRTLNDYTLCS